jgi:Flp pilus assembly protein TadG
MRFTKITPSQRAEQPRRGTYVVELAAILPFVLLLLLGIIDFALIMYSYGTVSEAARVGARYAIVHGSAAKSPVGPIANDTTVESRVRASALALAASQLTVTSSWSTGHNDPSCPVTVTATYNYHPFIGRLMGLKSVTLNGSTTMTITH